ncbi:MAG: IscS subfamily cysteine desulfurase [Proteobacteria bacterium]|nr:IscS subfamily cysteine desulfurase [Pseudomonadota bacterium]
MFMKPLQQIYFDYQSTTPCDPRVIEKMLPYFYEHFGNPHSRNHSYGWKAEEAVEQARDQVSQLIGADPKEVIFTSGATESNNLALKGIAEFYGDKKNHILTTVIEHKCVLESCRYLEQKGFNVTYLGVRPNGLIDLNDLEKAISPQTALVSIMAVNNEIGVIQPLKEIGRICREKGAFFHTDAAQAVGKIPLNVEQMNIDLMSLSGHKLYGPKGIGALYIRKKPRVRLKAQIQGGGQERGFRSGTLPTPLCVGLGHACLIAKGEMIEESKRIRQLSDKLYHGIFSCLNNVYLNGDRYERIPGNLNISFAYVEGESLLGRLREFSLSSGSACTSASLEPSYVLRALGVDEELAHTSIRFGLGRFTTEKEVKELTKSVITAVKELRELSPLWEMVQEGIDLKSIRWASH